MDDPMDACAIYSGKPYENESVITEFSSINDSSELINKIDELNNKYPNNPILVVTGSYEDIYPIPEYNIIQKEPNRSEDPKG